MADQVRGKGLTCLSSNRDKEKGENRASCGNHSIVHESMGGSWLIVSVKYLFTNGAQPPRGL